MDDPDDLQEPTPEEIDEYAEMIGIDLANEPDLIWIARQGIAAPIPLDWKPVQTNDGDLYFFNFKTGESSWEHPLDDHYKQMVREERKKFQLQSKLKKSKNKKGLDGPSDTPDGLASVKPIKSNKKVSKLSPLQPISAGGKQKPIPSKLAPLAPVAVPSVKTYPTLPNPLSGGDSSQEVASTRPKSKLTNIPPILTIDVSGTQNAGGAPASLDRPRTSRGSAGSAAPPKQVTM